MDVARKTSKEIVKHGHAAPAASCIKRRAPCLPFAALVLVSGCATEGVIYPGPYGTIGEMPGKVSLQIARNEDSGPGAWRLLRNDASLPAIVERYSGASPVAYCGRDERDIRICNEADKRLPVAQPYELKPKVTIGFLAIAEEGEKVAVKVQIDGEWHFLWEETGVVPKASR